MRLKKQTRITILSLLSPQNLKTNLLLLTLWPTTKTLKINQRIQLKKIKQKKCNKVNIFNWDISNSCLVSESHNELLKSEKDKSEIVHSDKNINKDILNDRESAKSEHLDQDHSEDNQSSSQNQEKTEPNKINIATKSKDNNDSHHEEDNQSHHSHVSTKIVNKDIKISQNEDIKDVEADQQSNFFTSNKIESKDNSKSHKNIVHIESLEKSNNKDENKSVKQSSKSINVNPSKFAVKNDDTSDLKSHSNKAPTIKSSNRSIAASNPKTVEKHTPPQSDKKSSKSIQQKKAVAKVEEQESSGPLKAHVKAKVSTQNIVKADRKPSVQSVGKEEGKSKPDPKPHHQKDKK